ncbi:unnamed protein product [Calypogeia fissa]
MADLAKRWSIQGKTALVTGGTRGIGKAVADELLGLGASVYVCGRSEETLAAVLKTWKEAGHNVGGSAADVSSREAREELMKKVHSFFKGKLDILVNNAGANIRKPTVEYTAEDMSFLMSTNFESAYHLNQLAHPLLKASGNSSIVFVSSVAGVTAIRSGTLYAASKAAMNQIAKNLACEWAKDGIRVNSVAPWYTKTDMVEQIFKEKFFLDDVVQRTPMRRIGTGQEVAAVVAFLCLPAAAYVTGQVVSVDGGFTANGFYPLTDV